MSETTHDNVVALRPRPEGIEDGSTPPKVRIRKLRVFALLLGLGLLAGVSTVFGMMMAIASDLPSIQKPEAVRNSVLVDRHGKRLGVLTGAENRFYVTSRDIPPVVRHAVIAIEDKRFYEHEGVDLRGIGRALYQDVVARKAVQGGSTITQQYVKNALAAQNERTLFNKLRESALAYHLTRNGEWTKEDVLRAYLNTIYFGNGAYGVEAAARIYFGSTHGCGTDSSTRCAQTLEPHEAALLAGIIASPSGYDPVRHPEGARARRELVLQRMLEQGFISELQFDESRIQPLPTRSDLQPPVEETDAPYFTSWIKEQVVERLGGGQEGARLAFDGGLRVETTLDSEIQAAAEDSVKAWLDPANGGPSASMVVLDNDTSEVLAMVANGGHEETEDYAERAFNLATQGQRQPGSAFKPFILAEALKQGISPSSTWTSRKKEFCVVRKRGRCREAFVVNNYEDSYTGVRNLTDATTYSDNAVYAEVGIKVGTDKIARLAERMGIRTPVSDNFAMTLGGLEQGVTPIDMAHAYETFARGGRLVYGTLSPGRGGGQTPGPVSIRKIEQCTSQSCGAKDREVVERGGEKLRNERRSREVLPVGVARQVEGILGTVVTRGTARRASLGEEFAAGKTGTTENYGDAWFVGWTKDFTVAVWVGYPDELRPMKTEFQGEAVAGGTFPAAIWKTFMEKALAIREGRRDPEDAEPGSSVTPAPTITGAPAESTTPAPAEEAPAPETGGGGGGGTGDTGGGQQTPVPEPEAPAPATTPAPQASPPSGGTAPPPAGTDGGAGPE
jgi:penicillin-binding protein 1A